MRRSIVALLGCGLVAAGLLLWLCVPVHAADTPAAGTWKLVVHENGTEISLLIIKLEGKKDKLTAETLSAGIPAFKDAKVEVDKTSAKAIDLTITRSDGAKFGATAYLPMDEEKPRRLRGSFTLGRNRLFLEMERTDLTELDPNPNKNQDSRGVQALKKAEDLDDDGEKEKALKALARKYSPRPISLAAHLSLMDLLAKNEKPEAEIRKEADAVISIASHYGPEMKRSAIMQVARHLLQAEKQDALVLDYARQAEKQLTSADPVQAMLPVLQLQSQALKNLGKKDELKKLDERIEKIEVDLDKEFLKTNIPFKTTPYKGRKGKSDRVAVVELFTGAQCPPCVAVDSAFDALIQTFKPEEVVLVQHHLHAPGPDALTNTDTEKRAEYYGANGTPTVYIDGTNDTSLVLGPRELALRSYGNLRRTLDKSLETDAEAKIKLSAKRKGDQIDIKANVSGLDKPGEDVRLRLMLVENLVHYRGSNGQRYHHHVVRAMPGGADGISLTKKSSDHTVKANVAEVTKSLKEYLAAAKKEGMRFPGNSQPMELKKLKVIALVQDDANDKRILQAAQVDVEEEK
jgi:hypothetical protein